MRACVCWPATLANPLKRELARLMYSDSYLMLMLQAPAQGPGFTLVGILPLIFIFVIFYFVLILPQQKRQKQLQETISSLKIGDRVITTGGIIGVITTVRDTSFLIRSADKSIIEIARSAIADLDREPEKGA